MSYFWTFLKRVCFVHSLKKWCIDGIWTDTDLHPETAVNKSQHSKCSKCPYRRNIVPPFIFECLLLSLVLFISSHFHLPDITILDWWSFQPLPSSQSVFGCFSLDMIAILSVSRSPELKVSINHMLALLHYNQHLDSRGSYEDVSRIKLPKSFSL